MRKPFTATWAIAAFIAVSPACNTPSLANNETVEDLPRYQEVSADLFRGGQPTDAGLEKLKENGFKTIVSLRCSHAVIAHEEEQAKKLGLTFVSIPMGGIHPPSSTKIQKFLSIVKDPDAKPVFVHCEEGVDRTGTMVAFFRQEVENWSAAQAYREMVKLGFHQSYFWLADAVFDYEEDKGNPYSPDRPFMVKVLDSVRWIVPRHKMRS